MLDLEYLTSFLSRVPALKLSQTRGRADGDRGRHENLIHLGVLSKLTCLHMERIPVDSIQDLVILRLYKYECSYLYDGDQKGFFNGG